MDLLERHHPRVSNSRAQDYDTVKANVPTLATSQNSIDTYYAVFLTWLETLALYPNFILFRTSSICISFIDGLHKPYDSVLLQEKDALIQHKNKHMALYTEPTLPTALSILELHNKLSRHFYTSITSRTRCGGVPRISSIISSPTEHSVKYYLLETGNWDDELLQEVDYSGNTLSESVLSISGSGGCKAWSHTSLEKPVPCQWAPYGKIHPPNICCICASTTHKVHRCWYVIGPPPGVASMIEGFKALKESNAPPFKTTDSISVLESKLNMKVCQLAPKLSSNETDANSDTTPLATNVCDSGKCVDSSMEYVIKAKEDAEDVNNAYMLALLRQHRSVTTIDLPFLSQADVSMVEVSPSTSSLPHNDTSSLPHNDPPTTNDQVCDVDDSDMNDDDNDEDI